MSDLNTDNQTEKVYPSAKNDKKQYGASVKRLLWTTTAKQHGLMVVQYVGGDQYI